MTSGFVSTSELDEERQRRQEEWEKVRKPEDPITAPEPEVCNLTLFEQLKNNKEVKQAELEEAKKFKNMIRGIDEDESDFLAQVDNMKHEANVQKRKEEEEMLKELAKTRTIASSANTRPLSLKPSTSAVTGAAPSVKSKQASILSSAIKRKLTPSTEDSSPKVSKTEEKPVTSMKGIIDYDSSDSGSSTDSDEETPTISVLRTSPRQKKQSEE